MAGVVEIALFLYDPSPQPDHRVGAFGVWWKRGHFRNTGWPE